MNKIDEWMDSFSDPRAVETVDILERMAEVADWHLRAEFMFSKKNGMDYKYFIDIITRGREFRQKDPRETRGYLRNESFGLLDNYETEVFGHNRNPMEYVLSFGESPESIDEQIKNYWAQKRNEDIQRREVQL